MYDNHPNIFIQGSPAGGINSSVIDDNSNLKNSESVRSILEEMELKDYLKLHHI